MVGLCLAGEGAQGFTHYETLADIDAAEVLTLCGGVAADAEEFAKQRGIPHWSLDLAECLRQVGALAALSFPPSLPPSRRRRC